ncbi:MAG TPA: hypothetical protein VN939_14030 [Chthoniobacterales bacterium]|jgi:hypothetical protein|nr:hypothetical protein [Chthoniobacterales bacterium]
MPLPNFTTILFRLSAISAQNNVEKSKEFKGWLPSSVEAILQAKPTADENELGFPPG